MKELDNNNAVVVENADYDIDKTYLYCGFAPDAETASIWYENPTTHPFRVRFFDAKKQLPGRLRITPREKREKLRNPSQTAVY